MKVTLLLHLLLLWIYTTHTKEDDNCKHLSKVTDKICKVHYTEHYESCVQKRLKRSNCNTECSTCDCDSCSQNTCKESCNSCCSRRITCYQSCIQRQHCTSNNCYNGCMSDCKNEGEKKKHSGEETVQTQRHSSNNLTTVKTVLNVHNYINTTNIVDVPVNISITPVNNITIIQSHPKLRHNQTGMKQCCKIVERKCDPTTKICENVTSSRCGDVCQTKLVTTTQRPAYIPTYPPVQIPPNYYYYPVYQQQYQQQYQRQYQQRQCWPFSYCKRQTVRVECAVCYFDRSERCYESCYGNQRCQNNGGCNHGNSGFDSYGGYGIYQQPSWFYPYWPAFNHVKRDVIEDQGGTVFENDVESEVIPFWETENTTDNITQSDGDKTVV